MSIDTLSTDQYRVTASDKFKDQSPVSQTLYEEASDRLKFWEKQAQQLHWHCPWNTTLEWNRPVATWFKNGRLNASENCLDVHLQDHGTKVAIIWEGENGTQRRISYQQLTDEVCQFAHALKNQLNVQKGDRVTLYMPMIPELVVAVLACARIGAIHSVVFGGFSVDSLADRIDDSESNIIITADGGFRRGHCLPLKDTVDQAIEKANHSVSKVVVVTYAQNKIHWEAGRDLNYHDLIKEAPTTLAPESMDSEDPLFILYTSGTTGKPKGIVHTTGGYLTHAKYSTKTVFDLQDNDIYWCTADVGWITGHTYLIYGPLANAATVFMMEGTPDFPDKDRFWEMIDRHKVTIFYTAPTAIRSFMKWGDDYVTRHDISSLRLLGTVGEPINPEAWQWYHRVVGKSKCPIVDTWWQTETGGIMISNIPALNDMKPGCAGLPLPGISAAILDNDGQPVSEGGGLLSLTEPWPSMLRGIWGDEARFKETYWDRFPTYFAGDGATIDDDGYIMVLGRVDDVLNVAGHRIGTMEVESALVACDGVAEAAVVGIADDIKFQAILAFVILKEGVFPDADTETQLIQNVGRQIGAIAKPKGIIFVPDLPKTRSGKIMRRVLKQLAAHETVGDTTTLASPDIVNIIQDNMTSHPLFQVKSTS